MIGATGDGTAENREGVVVVVVGKWGKRHTYANGGGGPTVQTQNDAVFSTRLLLRWVVSLGRHCII